MKANIAAAFSAGAADYDRLAHVQAEVARRLAARIAPALPAPPRRILEIGCGTGLLSAQLVRLYPRAELLVTDISSNMLDRARSRLHAKAGYRLMDGEFPDRDLGGFDLIASSLAMQWFIDLQGGIARLADLLAPKGRLIFATLGAQSFAEWRAAHTALGLTAGLYSYPPVQHFPWPCGRPGLIDAEIIQDHHPDGIAFLKALKALGAGQPRPGHTPLTPAQFRRVLAGFCNGCTASYQLLYGMLKSPLA